MEDTIKYFTCNVKLVNSVKLRKTSRLIFRDTSSGDIVHLKVKNNLTHTCNEI